MKVLVTGGAGFIGSHVVEYLLELGYEVNVVFDKNKPGKIPHLIDKVSFIHGDIRNPQACKRAVEDMEIIIHLAALINVDHSMLVPDAFFETNVHGTQNLLEAVRHEPTVKKFLYMSTCEVYGNVPKGQATEEYPCNPRSPYASSKYAAERYCLSYHHTYGNPEITVTRGFNTFGPRQSHDAKGAVTAIFINRILNGQAPIIFGDGTQSRDYVYVKSLAKGIVKAALTQGINGEIINLASGRTLTIRQIAEDILKVMNSDLKPAFREGRPGEVMRSCGNAEKAMNLIGWKAEENYSEQLKATVEYYRGGSAIL